MRSDARLTLSSAPCNNDWKPAMRMSATLLLFLSAVSACGGNGDSDSTVDETIKIDATPIKLFVDDKNSGVAKVVAVSNGEVATGYIISPELALVIAELEAANEVRPVDIDDIPDPVVDETNPNVTIIRGGIDEIAVTAAVTTAGDAVLLLIEDTSTGFGFLQSIGEQATDIPISGDVEYEGVLGLRGPFDDTPEEGTFIATASFDASPTITLGGATNSYELSGTANISDGSFTSEDMSIVVDGRVALDASINGDFHGEGANSLAGVVYSNDLSGSYRGGFIGSQD